MYVSTDRHFFEIFWKLREALKQQVAAAPDKSAERSHGVKRANLLDPEEFENKMEAMTVCRALELGTSCTKLVVLCI